MAEHTLTGGCRCGKVTLEVHLTSEPKGYNPRACDCDFCREHDAAYVSDPNGSVVVQVDAMSSLKFVRQGSELAEFILCKACDQLVGVRWQQRGSVNTRVLAERASFGKEVLASPKHLSAEQKTARWGELWFPEFEIVMTDA